VLIVVLWIMAILSIMVLSFGQAMRVEMQISHSYTDQLKALELAKSGIARALADLTADATDYDDRDDPWYSNEETYREVPLGDGTYTLLNVRYTDDTAPSFGFTDEAAKLNLNTATREQLVWLPGMTEELADAIVDWRDTDDVSGPQGAESDYYQSLERPYYCKNAPFETVEELLLVKGITREVLYGEDLNRNGVLDPNEDENGDGVLNRGLIDFVTAYSQEPEQTGRTTGSSGQQQQPQQQQSTQGLVNINTAPYEVLLALLEGSEDSARAIVDYRDSTAGISENAEWVRRAVSAQQYTRIQNLITTRSYQFRVQSIGKLTGKPVFKRIEAVIDRRSSPFKVVYWQDITHLGPPIAFEDANGVTRNDQ